MHTAYNTKDTRWNDCTAVQKGANVGNVTNGTWYRMNWIFLFEVKRFHLDANKLVSFRMNFSAPEVAQQLMTSTFLSKISSFWKLTAFQRIQKVESSTGVFHSWFMSILGVNNYEEILRCA